MNRNRKTIIAGLAILAIVAVYLVHRQKTFARSEQPASARLEEPAAMASTMAFDGLYSARRFNQLGDIVTDARDPIFTNQVFPKLREFLGRLDRLGVNPFHGEIQPSSCSKMRIIQIPNGIICLFVIGDGWTADYTSNPPFSGITHFGQRGPDNPYRAISHADTNALQRLSQGAITMSDAEVWKVANRVADAFEIDRSRFEEPTMHEEGLFEYHLGIYSVDYRKKGSDPANGLNYSRSFSLRATSAATAVLVRYSQLEMRDAMPGSSLHFRDR